jgi:hypothetical protein
MLHTPAGVIECQAVLAQAAAAQAPTIMSRFNIKKKAYTSMLPTPAGVIECQAVPTNTAAAQAPTTLSRSYITIEA